MSKPLDCSGAFTALHVAATAATGLEDFGETDYHAALQAYLAALDSAGRLDAEGWGRVQQLLVHALISRLFSQAAFKACPKLADQSIQRPIFLVGLPRTGTTALHKLLCQDPSSQGLEYWLGSFPQPRPPRHTWLGNPQYQAVAAGLHALFDASPELRAIHDMAADQPDECRLLLLQSFANVTLQANATVPDYTEWLYRADFSGAYARYRQNLQLIGSTAPGRRWVLKDPSHLWALDTLLATFPDACVIQTHREPAQLIPSVASLVYTARRLQEPSVDPAEIGPEQAQQWQRVWDKTMDIREQTGEERFFDLQFKTFVADPLASVARIYDHFGLELTTEARVCMQHWLDANPRDRHGRHHYEAADFGLDSAGIRRIFARYRERFSPQ